MLVDMDMMDHDIMDMVDIDMGTSWLVLPISWSPINWSTIEVHLV